MYVLGSSVENDVETAQQRRAGEVPRRFRGGRSTFAQMRPPHLLAVSVDAVVVMGALTVATLLTSWQQDWSRSDLTTHVLFALASLPVWLVIFSYQRMFSGRTDARLFQDLRRVVSSVVYGAMGMIVLAWPLQFPVSRAWILAVLAVVTPVLVAERQVVRTVGRKRRAAGRGLRPTAILGTNDEALDLMRSLADPELGRDVVVFIATTDDAPEMIQDVPVLRGVDPATAAAAYGAQLVVIAATSLDRGASPGLLRSFLDRGISVEITSALTDIAVDRISVQAVGRHPLISLDPGYRGGWRGMAKRAFDVVVAGVALIVLAPALAVIAVAVKLNSPGPVLFAQERVGRRGRPFQVLKFRSMVVDAEEMLAELRERNESDGPLFKMTDDPRVTSVGRFLRKTSLDEIPQLWNVVRGDMSLVGPRPALPSEAEQWSPELRNRLRVRPGITGMWQVSGRSSTSFEEYARLDLFYIDNWSFLTDMAILARTVPAVLRKEGAM